MSDWKSIKYDGMPVSGHDCYAAWNGRFWVKAHCFENQYGFRWFADLSEKKLRGITHYKFVGNGPEIKPA